MFYFLVLVPTRFSPMLTLDNITSQLYAIVKRNRTLRDFVKPFWQILPTLIFWWRNWFSCSLLILSPPTKICNSVEEWVKTSQTSSTQKPASYQLIYPSHTITRNLPKTLDQEVHWQFRSNQQWYLPDAFVATIPSGRVWGDGNVITPDNQLLAELTRTEVLDSIKNSIISKEQIPPCHKLSGSVAVCSCEYGTGYYHWMIEVLPRLGLLQQAGIAFEEIDYFLVNTCVSPFQLETLSALGIPRAKIIESHWYPHIQADLLIVPALVGEPNHIPKWACDFLRHSFLRERTNHNVQPKRLYINRKQVVHRKVENEKEIIEFLSSLGFYNIALESMSMFEKAELLSQAEVIVAPHGAGLTNTVFCQPGTKVIELLSPKGINFPFWSLSNQMELDHYYLLGEGEVLPEPTALSENIVVNLKSLSQILKLSGIE